jgi:hypothetical protein
MEEDSFKRIRVRGNMITDSSLDSTTLLNITLIQACTQTENSTGGIDEISLMQAKVLNIIGLRYCGDDELCEHAHRRRGDLSIYCTEQWKQSTTDCHLSPGNSSEDVAKDWKTWQVLETRRRIGYCVWLLDCMWAFHTDCRPLLSLRDATVPLPCQEVLWEAESALVWRQLFELATSETRLTARVNLLFADVDTIANPSLLASTQSLYIEKRL